MGTQKKIQRRKILRLGGNVGVKAVRELARKTKPDKTNGGKGGGPGGGGGEPAGGICGAWGCPLVYQGRTITGCDTVIRSDGTVVTRCYY